MRFNIKANVVELRSDPAPTGIWAINRGLAPGAKYAMTAHTDDERVLIDPLFDEFVAAVCDALAEVNVAAPSGDIGTTSYRETAELYRESAAMKREAARPWVEARRAEVASGAGEPAGLVFP